MPHHYGRSGTSMNKAQKGGTDVHGNTARERGIQKSQSNYVSKAKVTSKVTSTASNTGLTLEERNALEFKKPSPKKGGFNTLTTILTKGIVEGLNDITRADKKNWDFVFDPKNFTRIRANKKDLKLPDLKTIANMEPADIRKIYGNIRSSIMSNRENSLGEPMEVHHDKPPVKKVVGGQTILAAAPTEAEVSQSDATNAAETKLTKRRVKARGRKMTAYAQSKDKLILGKKSLLGMV
jgi:hypothetical protein